jgi:hypothetical protein
MITRQYESDCIWNLNCIIYRGVKYLYSIKSCLLGKQGGETMKKRTSALGWEFFIRVGVIAIVFTLLLVLVTPKAFAQQALTPPQPVVAIHISELTQALETMQAKPPTPVGTGTTGYEWYYTSWHYFVAYESLKEALRSDGTPFVEITDADIAAGALRFPDGSPRYPIVISLAAEAISDAEVAPLRDYVSGGGFLLVGSSAFTRNPDGTTRGDFALANEMGIHMMYSSLDNWDGNMGFVKLTDHRLVSNIPAGENYWRMPLTSEEIPLGVSPSHDIHGYHFVWVVNATDATVVAEGFYSNPFLAVKKYGNGNFIYHSALQPLIGHGGYDSGMYAYLIYRNAIKWAFESANVPIIKLSPWRYQYDAAFVVRHDFENYQDMIRSIQSSAAFEQSVGVKGDYYFCTGTLREHMADKNTVITSLRSAVSNYGATIGSHNGGLKNPVNLSLSPLDYDYWHWGPDEALNVTPTGYSNGKAYAEASMAKSYGDIESWMAGLDNGRTGCGATNSCPRIWAAPCFNSTREASYDLLQQLEIVTTGEQKVSPFPHWTVSTQTVGKRYEHLTLPVSDWYSGGSILQSLEYHSFSTMTAAVDFYYNLGALINLYGHNISNSGTLQGQYASYSAAKPKIWGTNAIGVYDWWTVRSEAVVTPTYSLIGDTAVARATISHVADINTAVEVVIPGWKGTGQFQVLFDDSPANTSDYRITQDGIRVRAGAAASSVEVRYPSGTTMGVALALNPTSVVGGNTSIGTVTLTAPAPNGGAVVSLSSSNSPVANVPSGVTILSGNTSATFSITTYQVSNSTSVTITASYAGTTGTANLGVTAVQLSSLTLSPTSVVGGNTSTGTVTLTAPAPNGGAAVSLSSNNSSVASVQASVTVASGNTKATFTVNTSPVSISNSVTITASYAGTTKTANLTVTAIQLSSLTLSPTSVVGGNISTGTVTLTAPAPNGGAAVSLSSNNSSVASVQASVTVAGGNTKATFTVNTSPVSISNSVTITASYAGTTRTANLTVTVMTVQLSSLTLSPTSVVGGNISTGTVTLTAPAPGGGTVVSLSSSNSLVASVPASVTVASGNTSATFTVSTTRPPYISTSVTISATYAGSRKTARLTVRR